MAQYRNQFRNQAFIAVTLVLAGACAAAAQVRIGQAFTVLAPGQMPAPAAFAGSVEGPRPTKGAVVAVDVATLARELAGAPVERLDQPLSGYGLALSLPGPTGAPVECVVAESPVMEPALAARFPSIRTFVVRSVDGRSHGRLELTGRGLTGMFRVAGGCKDESACSARHGGAWMIDLWQSADAGHIVSYWLADLPGSGDIGCMVKADGHIHAHDEAQEPLVPEGVPVPVASRRTVRLAMACTGEYGLRQSQVQGNPANVTDAINAIVTVVGRTNVVFETDLGVHFDLIATNDQLVFVDPATDPYSTTCDGVAGADCSGQYLSQNITQLNQRVGNANFDVGHLMTRVFGGVAYLRSVCTNNKAGGISGVPRGGDLDPLTALVAIHELGHQFGANHTFSGSRGRCLNNVNLSTAWEAGSGSSPMAYAGGCPVGDAPPSDNIVQFAEPWFHHGSLLEMNAFLNTAACPVLTTTTNPLPQIVGVPASASIPPGTPFVLTANVIDAGGDVLTYSWEQFDSGAARPLSGTGSLDNGAGALFRIFPPVLSPSRTFPRMADVLSGVPTPGEQLPTFPGVDRRFRVLVRDNNAQGGGVAISSFVTLTIAPGTTPFAVQSPGVGASARVRAGRVNLAWSVGNTDAAPVNCARVTVRLSADGGATFPTVLASVPNTGAAVITLPDLGSMTAGQHRLRLDAEGNVFFAVSRPLTLLRSCTSDADGDGTVDGTDFITFINAFSIGDATVDANADLVGTGPDGNQPDGTIDGADFIAFINAFAAGC